MDTPLTSLLRADAVPMSVLHERYGALLELVRKVIGVVPNCDPYLEIWPPAFRTYNVLVPNFLNLPFSLWGVGAPKDIVGLSLYVASRAAECAYCSAHTSSFALRRGATPEKVARALDGDDASFTPAERAAMRVGRALARVPCELTAADRGDLARCFTPAQAEWIVLGISMMGFLNKFMDAVGVELEGPTAAEVQGVISASGWRPGKHLGPDANLPSVEAPGADTLGTKLGVVPLIPTALSFERRWTAGVPNRWPAVGTFLRHNIGHDFPVLSRLQHGRAIRAIAVILRDNFDPATSVLGLPAKCAAGLVYAAVTGDTALGDDVRALAVYSHAPAELLDEALKVAGGGSPSPDGDARTRAMLLLARAASTSPAQISPGLLEECEKSGLSAAMIVELMVWLSVLQMLHRLSAFYTA